VWSIHRFATLLPPLECGEPGLPPRFVSTIPFVHPDGVAAIGRQTVFPELKLKSLGYITFAVFDEFAKEVVI
jgi:hypothetical protein